MGLKVIIIITPERIELIDTLIGKCGKRSDGRSIIIEIIVSFRLNQEH